MFLIEEMIAPNGQCLAAIYMRPDGLFEGRIYSQDQTAVEELGSGDDFRVCAIAETLPRVKVIVDEELCL